MNVKALTFRLALFFCSIAFCCPANELSSAELNKVRQLKITVLSTMLADGAEYGEWGFAALVEVDGHKILFDTGAHSDLVLKNSQSLKIDLGSIPDVILSHFHSDHVGGLLALRDTVLREKKPEALQRAHVGKGIFYPRLSPPSTEEDNPMIALKPAYEKTGGVFVSYDKPTELFPGVWLTGPVPRKYPEHNWSGDEKLKSPDGLVVEDNLPEDMAMIFNTDRGLVVLTGCGHAGVVNIVDYARSFVRAAPVYALIGGIHLFSAKDEVLKWTAEKLKGFEVKSFLGAHCTGIETVYRFRRDLDLDRAHAVVGAVGASFSLDGGIDPRNIAR